MANPFATAKDGPVEHPFADASVSFAVDVSGSTYGRTLKCEKSFVRRVATLLSERSRTTATVLPWHTVIGDVKSLSILDGLVSLYGTAPRVMLEDCRSRWALTNSTLWFLMTDGLINDRERQAFADRITEAGLHGTSCVTVIFGNLARGPSSCDISVGVSVFAMCTNCLFLFYDTDEEDIIIMQTNGVFNSLLRGAENPVFDGSSKWDTFPRLSLRDLSNIVIPEPTKLGADQVQLQDSLVIDLKDLWANNLGETQARTIFDDEGSLRTVTMGARASDKVAEFQAWLRQQRAPAEDPLHRARIDTGGQALSAFLEVSRAHEDGSQYMPALRAKLRAAHKKNMHHFLLICKVRHEISLDGQDRITSACRNRSQHSTRVKQTSPPASLGDSVLKKAMKPQRPQLAARQTIPGTVNHSTTFPSQDGLLWTPGFRCDDNDIKGTCSICGGTNRTLALLLHTGAQPESASLSVPRPEALEWPSRVSHLPENLLEIRNIRCCEACSTYWVASEVPENGKGNRSFPVVDYSRNDKLYRSRCRWLFHGRLDELSATRHFLSAMLTAYGKPDAQVSNVKNALRWVCTNLIGSVLGQQQVGKSHSGQKHSLDHDLRQLSTDADASISRVARYPVPGFVTVLQAASVLNMPEEVRRKMAFRRYLFLLSEGFDRLAKKNPEFNERLADLLWQGEEGEEGEADDPDLVIVSPAGEHSGEDAQKGPYPPRAPVLAIRVSKLRGSDLLSEADYELVTGAAEEFRQLLDDGAPGGGWVGRVTAVFLHALVDVHERHTYETAADLFGIVATRKEVAPVFAEPSAVDVDGVEAMLKSLRV